MSTTTSRGSRPALRLAQFDQDQANLQRARELFEQGCRARSSDPRVAFELVHRAALRAAGVVVARADRERRRKLPLNVWTALERIGGRWAELSARMAPFVAERSRLERSASAAPDPMLLQLHVEQTAGLLEEVSELLLAQLPEPAAALAR